LENKDMRRALLRKQEPFFISEGIIYGAEANINDLPELIPPEAG